MKRSCGIKVTVAECTHYWIIDYRDIGRCKYCGAVRDFGEQLRKLSGKEIEGRLERGRHSKGERPWKALSEELV